MNKETLQEYNAKLEENNTSLDNILTTINNLPEGGSNGSSSNCNIYSTEETVVGTWIDGKPLYRKIIIIDSVGNNINTEVPYYIENVDLIWIDEGTSYVTKPSHETLSINWFYGTNDFMRTWVNKNLGVIRYKVQANLTEYTGYITLKYTKTTD